MGYMTKWRKQRVSRVQVDVRASILECGRSTEGHRDPEPVHPLVHVALQRPTVAVQQGDERVVVDCLQQFDQFCGFIVTQRASLTAPQVARSLTCHRLRPQKYRRRLSIGICFVGERVLPDAEWPWSVLRLLFIAAQALPFETGICGGTEVTIEAFLFHVVQCRSDQQGGLIISPRASLYRQGSHDLHRQRPGLHNTGQARGEQRRQHRLFRSRGRDARKSRETASHEEDIKTDT
eukprot:scaffold4212_cov122-Isochrysis_galbana.AAC.17